MSKKGFVFPGLRYAGYEAGFSVRITPEMRRYDDLRFELILLRGGKRQHSVYLSIPAEPALYFRSWESSWSGALDENSSTDLYCLRIDSSSHPEANLPPGSLEGQMILRHLTHGWTSTILTGFIPLRAPIATTSAMRPRQRNKQTRPATRVSRCASSPAASTTSTTTWR